MIDPPGLGPAVEWMQWWQRQAGNDLARAGRGFVLSHEERTRAGISRQHARTRVRRGDWVDAGYGFIAPIDISDGSRYVMARRRHALEGAAAVRRRRGQVISGRSAAIVRGLPTFRIPDRPELTDPAATSLGRQRGTSHVYGAALHPDACTPWFGVPVTSVARTLVDLARHDRWDAIMAADAALRENLVTSAEIDRALATATGWPGVRQARAVLALATPKAESPLESLTRLRLHDDGFPVPDLQVWIGSDRVDMLLSEHRLILEIDGLAKYADDPLPHVTWTDDASQDDPLRREKKRETRLRRHNYRVERVTWDDVVNRWPQTSAWLREILRLPAKAG